MSRPLSRSSELPRTARRALRRHRSRAGALPRLHCVGPAALQSIEVSLKTDGGGGGDEVGVGEERQLAQGAAREALAPRRERMQHHRVSRRLRAGGRDAAMLTMTCYTYYDLLHLV